MAIVTTKAKKKPVLKGQVISNKMIGGGGVKLGGPAAPKAAAPAAAPKPVAPALDPTPPVIAPPRIELPSASADRITGREQFGTSVASANRALSALAQQLGGLSSVSQYNYGYTDPRDFGNVTASQRGINPNDPNSTMAVIARNLGKQMQFVGDTNENRNTWNSGIRLNEEDEQRTAASNAKTKALADYETARQDLVDQLTGGFGTLKGIIRGANAEDDTATAAAIAQAQAQAEAARTAAATAAQAAAARSVAPGTRPSMPSNATVFGHPMHFPTLSPYEEWRRRNPLGVWGR